MCNGRGWKRANTLQSIFFGDFEGIGVKFLIKPFISGINGNLSSPWLNLYSGISDNFGISQLTLIKYKIGWSFALKLKIKPITVENWTDKKNHLATLVLFLFREKLRLSKHLIPLFIWPQFGNILVGVCSYQLCHMEKNWLLSYFQVALWAVLSLVIPDCEFVHLIVHLKGSAIECNFGVA